MIPSGTANLDYSSPRDDVAMGAVFVRRLALRTLGLCVAAGTATLYPVPDAGAAVRICRPAVSGAAGEAKTEQEAKRFALESWVARAAQYGAAYASWRMANNKRLACRAGANGVTRCQATGQPCVIAQNPRPKQPKPPRKKSRGIEV
jgi:hypothetical protein